MMKLCFQRCFRLCLLGALFLGLVPGVVAAEVVSPQNPVLMRAAQLGQSGLAARATARKSPTSFRPTRERLIVEPYLKEMFEEETERGVMRAAIQAVLEGYEQEAKARKLSHDAAPALAFALAALYAVGTDTEPDDAAFLELVPRMRAALATPEVAAASSRQKQEAYELALCTTATIIGLAAATEDPATKQKLREAARSSVRALFGLELDALTLRGSEVALRTAAPAPGKPAPPVGKPAPAAPATPPEAAPPLAAGGLAPGFRFTPPQGWTQNSGWHIGSLREGSDVTSALIRFPPAMAAQGSFSDALRTAWKSYIPTELQGRAHNVVFRRYVGDGLVAQFMIARGPEKGRPNDSLFSLMLVDCGAAWQPVVVAQTYESQGLGIDFSTTYSFPVSANLADQALASLRCAGAAGQPIVDTKSLAGKYHFGNGASMDWINVVTGSTSTTFVSYGGTLHLRENGSFDYTYSSASGKVGATTYGGIRANGKWTIERDTLVLTYAKYDQGDSYHKKGERYRIASSMNFTDGEKLTVLLSGVDYDKPINAVTVTDSSNYYSTKAK